VPVPEFKPLSFLQFKFLKQSWTNLEPWYSSNFLSNPKL
jgi:hypothetical protein